MVSCLCFLPNLAAWSNVKQTCEISIWCLPEPSWCQEPTQSQLDGTLNMSSFVIMKRSKSAGVGGLSSVCPRRGQMETIPTNREALTTASSKTLPLIKCQVRPPLLLCSEASLSDSLPYLLAFVRGQPACFAFCSRLIILSIVLFLW